MLLVEGGAGLGKSRLLAEAERMARRLSFRTRQAQYEALRPWEIPNHSLLQRVAAIETPVFVSNHLILTRFSYLLAGLIPDARLKIYPDAAHGFLFQHHSEFAGGVHGFLSEAAA